MSALCQFALQHSAYNHSSHYSVLPGTCRVDPFCKTRKLGFSLI